MLNNYVNYTLTGEVSEIAEFDTPNDSYLRFYSCGYGLSQVYGGNLMPTSKKGAISSYEQNRVIALNLNGVQSPGQVLTNGDWAGYFKPFYDSIKSQYLADPCNFDPDVDWPVEWFKDAANVNVAEVNSTSVTVSWTTDSSSDSEVTYTSNGIWWNTYTTPTGPDGSKPDSNLVTSHSLTIAGLSSGKNYQFKIRSSNRQSGANRILWGYVGSFTKN
jgi:hypothetical protein